MSIAQDVATMDLIRQRLLNDERPLKRILKSFYSLATVPLPLPDSDSHSEFVEMCQRHHADFMLELNSLARSLSSTKGPRTTLTTREEIQSSSREKLKLQGQVEDEMKRISQLEIQLQLVRRERTWKLEYEEVGREVRRFSDRVQSAERIATLTSEISLLQSSQTLYSSRWSSRQAQFGTVVSNLLTLQESIREEKADADRQKALDDNEGEEEQAGGEETRPGSPRTRTPALDPSAPAFQPKSTAGDERMEVEDGEEREEGEERERRRRDHDDREREREEGEEEDSIE